MQHQNNQGITLFWFRQDLRLSDNPGLCEAAKQGAVMPIYILDDESAGEFKMGAASRWWLHHGLHKLNESLGGALNVYKGDAKDIILRLVEEHSIQNVYWNRCYEPTRIRDDAAIKSSLKEKDITCKSFNASLLWEPWDVLKSDKTPYKVFTPFYKNGCLNAPAPRQPLLKPDDLLCIRDDNGALSIKDLNLVPSLPWYTSFENHWTVGEEGAHNRLISFIDNGLKGYKDGRDYPSHHKTSRLSPHLHFGEISPHQIWWSIQKTTEPTADHDHFLRELIWREFSYTLLYHFPALPRENFQKKFDNFPWQHDEALLRAWQKGQTGYPIVDAGMRELWQTGTMHNRVRMIVASFLVKNLGIHWHYGADWFWDCLLDADLANNSASWQWVAGSGADAAPYFRIFNPITQGEKFDSDGIYTRRFVPELRDLPNAYLFKPWEAPAYILNAAGVILGKNYPKPIVDIKVSREKALDAFKTL